MAGPTTEDFGTISFATSGSWLSSELATLLVNVQRMYDVFLVGGLAARDVTPAETWAQPDVQFDEPEVVSIEAGEQVEIEAPIRFATGGSLIGSARDVSRTQRGLRLTGETVFTPGPRQLGGSWGSAHTYPYISAASSGFGQLPNEPLGLPVGDVQFIASHLSLLAPEAMLTVSRIKMASPGVVDLKGLGEPIKETGNFIEKVVTLPETRKRKKLRNTEKEEQIRHQVEMNAIEEGSGRVKAVVDAFRELYGENFREIPGVMEEMQKALGGAAAIGTLVASGRLELKKAA
jgi:hypothetical protein